MNRGACECHVFSAQTPTTLQKHDSNHLSDPPPSGRHFPDKPKRKNHDQSPFKDQSLVQATEMTDETTQDMQSLVDSGGNNPPLMILFAEVLKNASGFVCN